MENLLLLNEIVNTIIYVKQRIKYDIKYIDKFNILNKPPLKIEDYLKFLRIFSKHYYIDRKFQTIDYCVIMSIDQIVSCYLNKVLNHDEH